MSDLAINSELLQRVAEGSREEWRYEWRRPVISRAGPEKKFRTSRWFHYNTGIGEEKRALKRGMHE